jgi:L-ribulose-5-phosphate 3-epimerase
MTTVRISFMTANYVGRPLGYRMTRGWAEGDAATNAAFRPLDSYRQRLGEVLADARGAGFDAVDLWSAHLNAAWASDAHVAIARELLSEHRLSVTSLHARVSERGAFRRTCELANAVGTTIIGGGAPLLEQDREYVLATLREHVLRLAYENHPERSPEEMLHKLGDDAGGLVGTAVDTGWYATQECDPVEAIERLAPRVLHVHLKDVRAPRAHETCRWGEGVVPVQECVKALRRHGYAGDYMIEHEPECHDPTEDCRAMLPMLRGWLATDAP